MPYSSNKDTAPPSRIPCFFLLLFFCFFLRLFIDSKSQGIKHKGKRRFKSLRVFSNLSKLRDLLYFFRNTEYEGVLNFVFTRVFRFHIVYNPLPFNCHSKFVEFGFYFPCNRFQPNKSIESSLQ